MFRIFRITPMQLAAAGALAMAAPLSMAHGSPGVSWSITLGTPAPRIYAPAPVYVQPAPVYVQPAPVYVQPAPVYVRPAPAFGYGAPPYYVQEVRPAPRWHHYRHGHDHGGWHGNGGWHGRD